MLIGYAWVRAAEESFDLDLQKEALEAAGVDWLFVDMIDADTVKRPQLEQALLRLRKGDTLVVWRLDRIGRNLQHLIETIEHLNRQGIGLRALDDKIDTMTAAGKLMFPAFGALAKFQRHLNQEIENERAKAQTEDRRTGPKPKLDEQGQALALLLHKDPSNAVPDVCLKLGISRATLFRYLRRGSKRKAGRKPKAKMREVLSTGQERRVGEETRRPADGG
jgi:DNA invertase Pin-like site-specific DNA recombinase